MFVFSVVDSNVCGCSHHWNSGILELTPKYVIMCAPCITCLWTTSDSCMGTNSITSGMMGFFFFARASLNCQEKNWPSVAGTHRQLKVQEMAPVGKRSYPHSNREEENLTSLDTTSQNSHSEFMQSTLNWQDSVSIFLAGSLRAWLHSVVFSAFCKIMKKYV